MNFDVSLLEATDFCELSDKELKRKYKDLKKLDQKNSILDIVKIAISGIKRVYGHEFNKKDIEKLNDFLNDTILDSSNPEVFFAFLIYTLIQDLNEKQIHCLFTSSFLAEMYYLKAIRLYSFLGVNASINLNPQNDPFVRRRIFSFNIIFSTWEEIIYEHLCNLNTEKITNRSNLKFNSAFLFDANRVIYDFEKYIFKIQNNNIKINEFPIKSFIKLYENFSGTSATLFFEHKKIEKNYGTKTKIEFDHNIVMKKLKDPKEHFFSSKDEKARNIYKKIEELYKQGETVIVDVDDKEELEIISGFLKLKDVEHTIFSSKNDFSNPKILEILTPNKVTLLSNLLGSNIEAKLGGNWEEIAFLNTYKANNDSTSNFYKEKFKKELKTQKELAQAHIDKITQKGGINVIFASHYTESRCEYNILRNYIQYPIKNLIFYNCPDDEVYKDLRLNNLQFFQLKESEENKFIYKIFSKFLYHLKKYLTKKLLAQDSGYLFYSKTNN